MRILLVSDSHRSDLFLDIINYEQADQVFHLGDSEFKAVNLQMFDSIVQGNCDFDQQIPKTSIKEIQNLRFFMTHGHLYGVNYGDLDIVEEGLKNNCNIVIHGHTHVVAAHITNKVLVLNPGSIKQSRCSYKESYMVMFIDNEDIKIELKEANNNLLLDTFYFAKGELC